MKTVVVLLAAFAFASVGALGQGQFLFNTHNVTGGNVVQFFINGQPATGPDLSVQVFAGPDAAHLTSLTPILALNRTGAAAGFVNPFSAIYTVPGMTAGQSAIVAYSPAIDTISTSFFLAEAPVVLTEPPTPPNEVDLGTHAVAFTLPEPSTWAMLLLGLGGIVFAFTRRAPSASRHG